jgi:hypothetical protein
LSKNSGETKRKQKENKKETNLEGEDRKETKREQKGNKFSIDRQEGDK